ncbi:sodium:proton antiporter, partial [Tamlana crocina]|nr:sodium:proton antiporter [Tamlana crocina]
VKEDFKSKLAVSFFGIRGIGSIFYLSWAFVTFDYFEHKNELYAITAYIILISIVLHGLTAPTAIEYFRKKSLAEKEEAPN